MKKVLIIPRAGESCETICKELAHHNIEAVIDSPERELSVEGFVRIFVVIPNNSGQDRVRRISSLAMRATPPVQFSHPDITNIVAIVLKDLSA